MATDERFILPWDIWQDGVPGPPKPLYATDGGRGSFAYVDTSVYGIGQTHGAYTAHIPYYVDWSSVVIYGSAITSFPLRPGGGGGARVPGSRKFGSRAVGYSPNGVVLLRLYR